MSPPAPPPAERLLALAEDIRQSTVLDKLAYLIGQPAAQRLRRSADTARRELDAPRADVAVIGSFSSGKSTLLNKLLGQEVLPSGRGVVTTRPVWLVPGEHLRGGFWDGQVFTGKALPEGQPVPRWILEQQDGPEEGWLRVELPGWPLGTGVRLLDTPGFNSEVASHHGRTAEALAHAEVALVIVEPRGLAADVRDFLREHVVGKVPAVAFVLNQLDLVDAAEVPELVERCRSLARHELGLPQAPVMVCSARGVVDPESGLDGWRPVRTWLEELARSQVPGLVSRKMSDALREVLAQVRQGVDEEGSRLKAARRTLEEQMDQHDGGLTGTYRKQMMDLYGQRAGRVLREASAALQAEQARMEEALESWLGDDESELLDEARVNARLKELLDGSSGHLAEEVRRASRALHEAMAQTARQLDEKLAERWRDLVRQLPAPIQGPNQMDALQVVEAEWNASVSVGDLPSSTTSVLGGAVAGAAAGTFIPIIGTAIGGLLGGLAAWFLSDPKEEARKVIRTCAREQVEKLQAQGKERLEQLSGAYEKQLRRVLKRRLTLFRERLAAALESLRARQAELEGREHLVTATSWELEEWLSRAGR